MKITGVGCAALMALGIAILAGCGKQDAQEPDMQREIGTYRAQDGTLSEHLYVTEEGYVQGFTGQEDTCDFQITVAEDGFYDLKFRAAGLGGYKENRILVDDISVGNLVSSTEEFEEKVIKRNFLSAGEHKITVEGYWGYIALDSLTVLESKELAEDRELDVTLSNPDAGECARRLMSYLADQYGKNFISGQYCDGGLYGHEMACIFKATGKFPAMVGLDMMEYSPSRVANGSEGKSILLAQEAWEKGAIVTMCWHWNAPERYLTGQWYSGFYKDSTNISLDDIMSGKDEEGYQLLLSDMDAVAKELQTLRDAKVPILWRPLHEASGGWFWWGDCSPDSYCKLYRLMYEKFTKEYELDNLIWVWNGQSGQWYPGDDVVDLVGEDIYAGNHVYSSQINKYMEVEEYTDTRKMVVLSENGCLFDPDLAIRDGAMWGYFGTWGGEFVTKSSTLNIWSEEYTEEAMVQKVYQHERVITLDELPDLKTYPIREDVN